MSGKEKQGLDLMEVMIVVAIVIIIGAIFWPHRHTLLNIKTPVAEKTVPAGK